jgi:hypothetical protein
MKSPLVWAVTTITALAAIFAIAAGNWIDVLNAATIGALFWWGVLLTDRVTELTGDRDKWRDAAIDLRLRHYTRNPRYDWEN